MAAVGVLGLICGVAVYIHRHANRHSRIWLAKGIDLGLLRQSFIRDDLDLSIAQQFDLDRLLDDTSRRWESLQKSLDGASRQERMDETEGFEKDAAAKIDALLDEKQRARFQQIRLQQRGAGALADPAIAAALKLDAEQMKKIADLKQARNKFVLEATQAAGGRVAEEFPKIAKADSLYSEQMLDVLTPEQKSAFEKLQGKKLDWPAIPGLPPAGR